MCFSFLNITYFVQKKRIRAIASHVSALKMEEVPKSIASSIM